MIKSFNDKETERFFRGWVSRRLPLDILSRAKRQLLKLDAACSLDDLRLPPSNNLEALHGAREGQYSIRINRQWRVCFVFRDGNADEVEIVDYH
jgi:proteic killer suppression protein